MTHWANEGYNMWTEPRVNKWRFFFLINFWSPSDPNRVRYSLPSYSHGISGNNLWASPFTAVGPSEASVFFFASELLTILIHWGKWSENDESSIPKSLKFGAQLEKCHFGAVQIEDIFTEKSFIVISQRRNIQPLMNSWLSNYFQNRTDVDVRESFPVLLGRPSQDWFTSARLKCLLFSIR